MTALQIEVLEAFRSIDVPEEKAIKAAAALSLAYAKAETETNANFQKRDAEVDLVRKDISKSISEIQKDIEAVRRDSTSIKLDVAGVKGEQVLLRWMVGFGLAMLVTLLFRSFTH